MALAPPARHGDPVVAAHPMEGGVSRRRSSFPLVLEPAQARAVARRAKTQLRRLATTSRLTDGSMVARACGLRVANTYEVAEDLPDAEPLARIVVTGVELQRLGDMTTVDAQAEGFPDMTSFADWWLCRHDARSWPPTEPKLCSNCHGHAEYRNHAGDLVPCNVPGCEVGEVQAPVAFPTEPRGPVGLATRFVESEWVDRHVWVVHFMLDDRRFLHRKSQRGYTSNPAEAMVGEPEVIGEPLPVWRARAEQRRRTDSSDIDATRLSLSLSHEDELGDLAELQRMAAERRVDTTRERHVINEARQDIVRKVRRAA